MPQLKNREYRNIQPMGTIDENKRIDSDYYVEGYATTYEPYMLYEDVDGPIYEKFERGCFVGCDMSDIIMQYDHNGKVLARQRNNSLIVEVDDIGLFVAADLSKSEASRSLYEEINNGLTDRMSWGFMPQEYYYDQNTRTIVHTRIKKIFDVSAVSIPANDNTNIQARAFADGVIGESLQELKKLEEQRKKLLLKIKLEELR